MTLIENLCRNLGQGNFLNVELITKDKSSVSVEKCNKADQQLYEGRCTKPGHKTWWCHLSVEQDNLSVFLRGCEELGLKGSQLFDPGDLQDTSTRPAA
ncbi:hypothetical protein AMECASPLE_036853, partial [Ameca splendens]